jgi:hypothetical protein
MWGERRSLYSEDVIVTKVYDIKEPVNIQIKAAGNPK